MRRLAMLAAVLAALVASPAAAAIIASGAVTPSSGYGFQAHGANVFVPGTYRLTVTLDRAVDYLFLTNRTVEVYNEYCDPDGNGIIVYCGGNDVPTEPFADGASVSSVSLVFELGAPFITPGPGGAYSTTSFYDDGGYFEFYTGEDADFAYTLDLALVPEPASWALLIFGFGAIGVMARRAHAPGARPRLA